MQRDVQILSVVGCGQMGIGIAFVAAIHAEIPNIVLVDLSLDRAKQGRDALREQVLHAAKYRRIDPNRVNKIMDSVHVVAGIEELSTSSDGHTPDLVIEAAAEDMEIKQQLFARLAKHLPLSTILATNTSSLSVTTIARAASEVFEDAPSAESSAQRVMRLVEIIPGLQTSQDVIERASQFATSCRKRTVLCVDTPGFIVNRINIAAVREAIRMAESKEASYEDIDKAMVLGMRHPMGPLRLADFVGLHFTISRSVMQIIHKDTQDPHYAPPILLQRMVQAGWLGKKSGQGFYNYRAKA
ncbi:3-hydroxybutyryl-CoA dehydrogenase [Malassezia psittaci]|uniref:3-hydroxybutyryl-CoA dehydrogenase n=1 Tax=Malassezia psittaci TaxID=1821823 RepID=A0AAF0FCQ1_9BASI|nr:3-hydroxybutyryl-CoA dehydrogenase [Malassezia psittaci]